MRNSFEIWCEPTEVSVSLIEKLSNEAVEQHITPDTVFITSDLYKYLVGALYNNRLYFTQNMAPISTGVVTFTLYTSFGSLDFKIIAGEGYMHVGNQWSYNNRIRLFVDKEFEDVVLGDT